ncbi:hypothetical protein EV361DRAFT_948251 [Lentinula raphanica]|nr:hypothetical protein FB446DRAFT_845349 [Lentinula raphanica]KAJ3973060.1 hypothetical protein EV361DRAFT_948251 [Lentinula raphanica]
MAASRSPGLAIAAATAISISAGAMFAMQKDTKRKEGQASIFQPGDSDRTVGKSGDAHLSSAEVSEVVSQRASRGNPNGNGKQ